MDKNKILKQLVYNKHTGKFYWALTKNQNAIKGEEAGCIQKNGYIAIGISGKKYYAHRLAWLFITGDWPINHIDHLDGDRTNNKWVNLRDVSQKINNQNIRKPMSRSAVPLLGVFKTCSGEKKPYRAMININNKSKYLGTFDTAEEAHLAYLKAKRKYHEGCTL